MNARHLSSSTVCAVVALLLAACSGSPDRAAFEDGAQGDGGTGAPSTPGGDLGTGQTSPPPAEEPEVHEVFGHSAKTLYKLEPATNAISVIGAFQGCGQVTDIALDEQSTLYAVSTDTLYTVDKGSAACTKVRSGTYPNSLSFVPKGTLDPNAEALVGYDDGDYVRIDVTTGKVSVVGHLGGGYVSSGDIVSVKGGKTYLTVKGGGCTANDCLVEVDPVTGSMLQNWGSIGHSSVFGLAFWGGSVYGFSDGGEVFQVTFDGNGITTSNIPIPQKPSNLSFWGAGSSTSAPLTTPK
jgi:hypothetical protein